MTIRLLLGDCRDVLRTLPDASVDSIVTDPPYELTGARPGGRTEATRGKVMGGFMGMTWDATGVAFDPETWRAALRVLKPGGYLLAFGGTRTYHRMTCAIEDAGFEIRDCIFWHYGQGFPKSHNLDKERGRAVCGCEPMERVAASSEHDVRSMRETDLQAAEHAGSQRHQVVQPQMPEPATRERSPAHAGNDLAPSEVAARGKERRVEGRSDAQTSEGELHGGPLRARSGLGAADGAQGRLHHGASAGDGAAVRLPADAHGSCRSPGPQPGEQRAEQSAAVSDERGSQTWRGWQVCAGCGKPILPKGLGTALKPATEPIVMARKSVDGTVIANVLKHGTGALNIDGCRVAHDEECRMMAPSRANIDSPSDKCRQAGRRTAVLELKPDGRWPANLIHDGSDEVLAAFPQAPGQLADASSSSSSRKTQNVYGAMKRGNGRGDEPSADSENAGAVGFKMKPGARRGDSGSAARFFYCSKASPSDRGPDNTHPTVKPTDLMRYLCRLVTPPGGTVLDPFAGSGSTLKAAELEGFSAIGIELSAEYIEIARRRITADAPLFASVVMAV